MAESTRERYLRAAGELAATSDRQVEWCRGVADDPAVIALLDGLPPAARTPSLLFAVAAWLGAPDAGYPAWADWVRAHATELAAELPRRRVQTNEPLRCVPLLVALARIPGPLALVELGASAGLCLYPDRYGYRLRTPDGVRELGDGPPVLEAELAGEGAAALVREAPPDIRDRRGVDLAPLAVTDPDHVRWLEASLPPDRPDRRRRLHDAVGVVSADPPELVAGDALRALPALLAAAPAGATGVVVSLGTAVYLPAADRERLPGLVAAGGARLVSYERRGALPAVERRWAALADDGRADPAAEFLLALDGEPLASGSAHGDRLVAVSAGRSGHPGTRT